MPTIYYVYFIGVALKSKKYHSINHCVTDPLRFDTDPYPNFTQIVNIQTK